MKKFLRISAAKKDDNLLVDRSIGSIAVSISVKV